MSQPIVSIITPFKNAKTFIPGFISCLKAQTFTDWIAIMVDDHSSDDGVQLVQDLTFGDSRFLILINPSQQIIPGPASARNHALRQVKTQLIAFCDVDDLWHPYKLSNHVAFHLDRSLDLSVTAYCRFRATNQPNSYNNIICPPSHLLLRDLLIKNHLPMLSVLVCSSLISGRYFLETNHEDFYYWLSLFVDKSDIRYGCIKQVLAFYRLHDKNISGNKILMPLWTYKVYRQLSLSRYKSLKLLMNWMLAHALARIRSTISNPTPLPDTNQLMNLPPVILE